LVLFHPWEVWELVLRRCAQWNRGREAANDDTFFSGSLVLLPLCKPDGRALVERNGLVMVKNDIVFNREAYCSVSSLEAGYASVIADG